jgi:hypothetical protein
MNYSTMLLHAVLEEDEKYVRVAGADSGFLSRDLRARIKKYLEERKNDGPMTSESSQSLATALLECFPPLTVPFAPSELGKYAKENPPRTREQAIREINIDRLNPVTAPASEHKHEELLGIMGLVQCPNCKGAGKFTIPPHEAYAGETYSCVACLVNGKITGKVMKQISIDELHAALNDISLKHARGE